MELASNDYYAMRLRDRTIELEWLSATDNMTDAAFKDALTVYADLAMEHTARGLLVDIRAFRHRPGAEIGPWRVEAIIPKYNKAGVRRFAYVMPSGADLPPASEGGAANPDGEKFETRFFDDEGRARDWLAGA